LRHRTVQRSFTASRYTYCGVALDVRFGDRPVGNNNNRGTQNTALTAAGAAVMKTDVIAHGFVMNTGLREMIHHQTERLAQASARPINIVSVNLSVESLTGGRLPQKRCQVHVQFDDGQSSDEVAGDPDVGRSVTEAFERVMLMRRLRR
jgi:hypothetical protein